VDDRNGTASLYFVGIACEARAHVYAAQISRLVYEQERKGEEGKQSGEEIGVSIDTLEINRWCLDRRQLSILLHDRVAIRK